MDEVVEAWNRAVASLIEAMQQMVDAIVEVWNAVAAFVEALPQQTHRAIYPGRHEVYTQRGRNR